MKDQEREDDAGACSSPCCSAALFAQDFAEINFDHLAKGLGFTEGPAWSAKDGYLIFSDTPGDQLWKWIPGNEIDVFRENADGPSGNAFDARGPAVHLRDPRAPRDPHG